MAGVVAMVFEDDDRKDLGAIARQVEEQSRRETQEAIERFKERNRKENLRRYGCDCPAAKCYASCPRYLAQSKEDDFFYWWGRTSPPDNKVKEAIMHLRGGHVKGGGSKSGRKRKKPRPHSINYLFEN